MQLLNYRRSRPHFAFRVVLLHVLTIHVGGGCMAWRVSLHISILGSAGSVVVCALKPKCRRPCKLAFKAETAQAAIANEIEHGIIM